MLNRGFCDREKSKVPAKSGSENLKPIRDGYKHPTPPASMVSLLPRTRGTALL